MGLSYTASKKLATKTIVILAIITLVEVFIALLGKGYLISGVELPLMLIGGFMIILSAFKAYLIVYEFMHMKYEMPSLRKSVILPTLLLVWALIAFMWEGKSWGLSRSNDSVRIENVQSVNDHSKEHSAPKDHLESDQH